MHAQNGIILRFFEQKVVFCHSVQSSIIPWNASTSRVRIKVGHEPSNYLHFSSWWSLNEGVFPLPSSSSLLMLIAHILITEEEFLYSVCIRTVFSSNFMKLKNHFCFSYFYPTSVREAICSHVCVAKYRNDGSLVTPFLLTSK